MKGKFPNGLADALRAANVSQAELARLTGENPQTIGKLYAEERELTRIWAERFAPHLGVAPADLVFGAGTTEFRRVPLISSIAAGAWLAVTETVLEHEEPPRWVTERLPEGDWIAFEVVGDSMNVIAPDGAQIFVNRKERELMNGYFYAVCLENGDATFKRFRTDPPRLEPLSTNPAHETMFFTDQGQLNVVGRVRKVVNDLP